MSLHFATMVFKCSRRSGCIRKMREYKLSFVILSICLSTSAAVSGTGAPGAPGTAGAVIAATGATGMGAGCQGLVEPKSEKLQTEIVGL